MPTVKINSETRIGIFMLVLAQGVTGCSQDDHSTVALARISAFSTYSASLGTTIHVAGDYPMDAVYAFNFRGSYTREDGTASAVTSARLSAQRVSPSLLDMDLSPFSHPFDKQQQPGVFKGTVELEATMANGAMLAGEPFDIEFEIEPSIVVREFAPVVCNMPVAQRLLAGGSYQLTVEFLGFNPTQVDYEFHAPGFHGGVQRLTHHSIQEKIDIVGPDDGLIALPSVSDDVSGYSLSVIITAFGADGSKVVSEFTGTVHRVIEVVPGDVLRIGSCDDFAELGCTSDGEASVKVPPELIRTKSYAVDWNQMPGLREESPLATLPGYSDGIIPTFYDPNQDRLVWMAPGSAGLDDRLLQDEISCAMTSEDRNFPVPGVDPMVKPTSPSSWAGTDQIHKRCSEYDPIVSARNSLGMELYSQREQTEDQAALLYVQAVQLIRRLDILRHDACGNASLIGTVDFTDWFWTPQWVSAPSCSNAAQVPPSTCEVRH